MTSISMNAFLSSLDVIAAQTPSYRLGGDGSDGTCDCIGLIIGAIRMANGRWTGIHGSNYAARNALTWLRAIGDAAELQPGMLVFKARTAEQNGYALPNRYQSHGDQHDYYHVGVVRSNAPLRIIHCTSPGGITTDTKLGQWAFCGPLQCIAQEDASSTDALIATVTAPSGTSVNLRTSPGGPLLARIPLGRRATIHAQHEDWCQVTCNALTGWMMACYLTTAQQQEPPAAPTFDDLVRRVEQLEARLTALDGGIADE